MLRMSMELRKGDYLLLLLYANNCAPIRGRTRMQKIAFLFEKEILKKLKAASKKDISSEVFGFMAYKYGPFSTKVFDFLELFISLGLVKIKASQECIECEEDIEIFSNDLMELFETDEDKTEDIEEASGMVTPNSEPVYSLTNKGRQYVEKIWIPLNLQQKKILNDFKREIIKLPLKVLLRYVYTEYPESAKESEVKERILEETKWSF